MKFKSFQSQSKRQGSKKHVWRIASRGGGRLRENGTRSGKYDTCRVKALNNTCGVKPLSSWLVISRPVRVCNCTSCKLFFSLFSINVKLCRTPEEEEEADQYLRVAENLRVPYDGLDPIPLHHPVARGSRRFPLEPNVGWMKFSPTEMTKSLVRLWMNNWSSWSHYRRARLRMDPLRLRER